MSDILHLLQLEPSAQSDDYVRNKGQFHLYTLLTEQRHPKTWNLSFALQSETAAGLEMLLAVDRDIVERLGTLAQQPEILEQAVQALDRAISSGRRVYVYGCGATGRLAKQMESTFWKPFWLKVQSRPCWLKLKSHLPAYIQDSLVGEMTGADRALVSSLEGFEDLQMLGRLQLQDHGVRRGDVVICVTEGGETSSVIGTILGALDQYGELDESGCREAREHLYFVYNNPDEVLLPFGRSATVIDNAAITKINLATGPQGITGSTRLQATTSETFVVGALLEEAIGRILRRWLEPNELQDLGFGDDAGLTARLACFSRVKQAVDDSVARLAGFTRLETDTYRNGRFATYFAKTALITVFIDNTERSPTFRLFPLDRVDDPGRRCWVQVWTEATDAPGAWRRFLGRPFRGMASSFYKQPFEEQVADPYLRQAALRSLTQAGDDQERLYDFSFSAVNVERRGPQPGDLGVLVLVDEEIAELGQPSSSTYRFVRLCRDRGSRLAVVAVTDTDHGSLIADANRHLNPEDTLVPILCPPGDDPLTLQRQIALKMLLNAHSTAIMASLGRVVGNTMTNVSPSNLKLIGRATFLILSHVNDTISGAAWVAAHGPSEPVSFAEANAVLFDAIDYVQSAAPGQTAEVALSIIRIVAAMERNGAVTWDEARLILEKEGLAPFLLRHNPALAASR